MTICCTEENAKRIEKKEKGFNRCCFCIYLGSLNEYLFEKKLLIVHIFREHFSMCVYFFLFWFRGIDVGIDCTNS